MIVFAIVRRHGQEAVAASENDFEIVVHDTGVGAGPDLREVIFTKFSQPGDLKNTRPAKTGLKSGAQGLD